MERQVAPLGAATGGKQKGVWEGGGGRKVEKGVA